VASVARTVYSGNYDGLRSGWKEFLAWIDKNNYAWRKSVAMMGRWSEDRHCRILFFIGFGTVATAAVNLAS
jgi:hypothetical protein